MITLAYPATAPTVSVTLSGPDFGDIWREAQAFVQSFNLSGELLENTDADKPKIKTFEYTFHGMSQTLKDAALSLVASAIGNKILVTDYLTNELTCYVSNEDLEVITNQDSCNYDLRLQFLVPVS